MYKIGFIIAIMLLYMTGCSSIKKSASIIENNREKIVFDELAGNIQKFNITGNNFYIRKAEIEVYNKNESQKLLGSIKYKRTGEYILSIRLRSGIEAARFYISRDTILINDRINRKLYYGSPDYLEEKYGINITFLPMLFGDFSKENEIIRMEEKCINNELRMESYIKEKGMQLVVDCKWIKVKQVQIENKDKSAGINMNFEDFYRKEGIIFPRSIKIEDFTSESIIKIFIRKIEIPWDGVLEFIEGKNYETVRLR